MLSANFWQGEHEREGAIMNRFQRTCRSLTLLAASCLLGLTMTGMAAPAAKAWDAATLFHFQDKYGFRVPAGVIKKDGALYGVVSDGGTLGCGSVFKLTPGAIGDPW